MCLSQGFVGLGQYAGLYQMCYCECLSGVLEGLYPGHRDSKPHSFQLTLSERHSLKAPAPEPHPLKPRTQDPRHFET